MHAMTLTQELAFWLLLHLPVVLGVLAVVGIAGLWWVARRFRRATNGGGES